MKPIKLSVSLFGVGVLSVVLPSVVIPSVVMLSVVMLGVWAPKKWSSGLKLGNSYERKSSEQLNSMY